MDIISKWRKVKTDMYSIFNE